MLAFFFHPPRPRGVGINCLVCQNGEACLAWRNEYLNVDHCELRINKVCICTNDHSDRIVAYARYYHFFKNSILDFLKKSGRKLARRHFRHSTWLHSAKLMQSQAPGLSEKKYFCIGWQHSTELMPSQPRVKGENMFFSSLHFRNTRNFE